MIALRTLNLDKTDTSFEYFCYNCGQLRLSLCINQNNCNHCGSTHILKGEPGTLDKDFLKKIHALSMAMLENYSKGELDVDR